MYKYIVYGYDTLTTITLHRSEQSAMKRVSTICGELTTVSKERARKFLEAGLPVYTAINFSKAADPYISASVFPINEQE